jgi:geranylgeranyl diphosphate synthase type I
MIEETRARWLEGHARYLDGFYDMMRYQLASDREPEQFASRLCRLCALATGAPDSTASRAANAVELLLASFAIHDDLERARPATAGRPTLWTRCGLPQALNTGDGLFSLAANALLEVAERPETSVRVVRELMVVSLAYVNGQHQLLHAGEEEPASLQAAVLRFGSPAGYAAWLGAQLGDADESVAALFRKFGNAVGTAMQLPQDLQEERPRLLENARSALEALPLTAEQREPFRDLLDRL